MLEQKQQIAVNIDPNLYAITNVNVVQREEDFIFTIFSGAQARQFLATPKHAKRIYLVLKQQIENYEKTFGELKTELPPANPHTTQKEKDLGFAKH